MAQEEFLLNGQDTKNGCYFAYFFTFTEPPNPSSLSIMATFIF